MGDLEGTPLGPCKHCGDAIVEKAPGDRIHVEGPGRGLHNCQSDRVAYGHHAEPMGEPCRAESPNPCLGARIVDGHRLSRVWTFGGRQYRWNHDLREWVPA